MTPHDYLLDHVARILEADEWFAEHRVHIIKQNSADLAEELQKEDARIDGVCLVVAYDRETAIDSVPRQLAVDFSRLATEWPALNRCEGEWATALDAAHRARRDIEEADRSLIYRDAVHASPEPGMLTVTARFNTRLGEAQSPTETDT